MSEQTQLMGSRSHLEDKSLSDKLFPQNIKYSVLFCASSDFSLCNSFSDICALHFF